VARAQGERGTGMSRFASRARRHSDQIESKKNRFVNESVLFALSRLM
ncbi:MAG: hypothetical protein, partial [Olavius algarvensis Gamma 1 endosymbiont]